MARLFDAYAPHRAEPARLPLLDVFNWEDVMVNAIYGDGLRALARLCDAAGLPTGRASELNARAARVTAALQEQCWDEQAGVFWDRYGRADHSARVLTFTDEVPEAVHTQRGLHRPSGPDTKPVERSRGPIKDRLRPCSPAAPGSAW